MNKRIIAAMLSLLIDLNVQAESVETRQENRIFSQSVAITNAFLGDGANSFSLNLPEVNVDLTSTSPGIQKTGTVYQLPSPLLSSQLTWQPFNDGYTARIHLISVQAKRLRIHLVFNKKVQAIVFRLQGSEDASPLNPIDQTFIHDNNIWLPITKGNNADLELFINDKTSVDGLFSIDSINIMVEQFSSDSSLDLITQVVKNTSMPIVKSQSLFLAQEKEYDLACWSGNKQYPSLQKAAGGTAKIEFIKNGGSFICTGTLLNDNRSSFIPWFVTANHCLSNQTIANTASFEWFSQAASCGGFLTDSRDTQTSGGAKLLWKNVNNDVSFLRLNALPPSGVSYVGWNSNKLIVGNPVWGVHHPQGDHTMVSKGKVTDLSTRVRGEDGRIRTLNEVSYRYGATEKGSSGSGIFSTTNGSPKWRGALYGGPITDSQLSFYSDFNRYFPKIKRWLAPRKRR